MDSYDEAYNQGWQDAVSKLARFLEQRRERMIGMDLHAATAQMALTCDIATEMEIPQVWGFTVTAK